MRARGRHKRTPVGTMNRLEQAYADELRRQQDAGEIHSFAYERIKLKLGDQRCTWSPDFYVLDMDGFIEIHECKGFLEQHAAVKIKVAAAMFPEWTFKLIRKRKKKDGGGFDISVIGPKKWGEDE